MPQAPGGLQERSPMAGRPAWRALRDRAYTLIVTRAAQAGAPSFGDAADQRFLTGLSRLDPGPDDEAYLLGWLHDLGDDIGRHVYAKLIVGDDLPAAISALSDALDETGIGQLEVADRFHRTANLRFAPGPATDDIHPGALWSYVAGLIVGTLSEALNCQVLLSHGGGETLELTLGQGKDINQEAHERG